MEAEQILELIESCWFERRIIFRSKHEFPALAAESTHQKSDQNGEKSRSHNLGIRSHSDRCIGVGFEADSPTSVIIKPRLQKILSGEEGLDLPVFAGREIKREKRRIRRERGRNRKISRSLSALEFEELKGFMDLGFVFNEQEETNPNLVSIVPGLQKWRKAATVAADGAEMKARVSRPYLSEAWGDLCWGRGDEIFLMNWKIPSVKNEIDMKDHLKNWAHVVASTVR